MDIQTNMDKTTKILILIGGSERPLLPFLKAAKKVDCQLKIASFSRINYLTQAGNFTLKVDDFDLADFDVVYIRLVGKRFEEAALVSQYLQDKQILLVDEIFTKKGLNRLPLPKAIETKLLVQAGVPMPKTFFSSLKMISQEAPEIFGYPFVIKGTTGKQGHAVWSPRNESELKEMVIKLKLLEKKGMRFVSQEFICASQRHRLLVIGDQVAAAITRPTRWRKRFLGKEAIPGQRQELKPIPLEEKKIALMAAKNLGIEVGGVDIIKEDKTGKLFVLEVNSAPRWASIQQDCQIDIEKTILEYLINKVKK